MKETDLMIGDWVCLVDPDTKKRTNTKVRGSDLCGGGTFCLQWFEPIPLTAEILEKNGFYNSGSGDHTKMLLSHDEDENEIRYAIYVGLKFKTINCMASFDELEKPGWRKSNGVEMDVCGPYVHELQHALKLCGIEKEIIL